LTTGEEFLVDGVFTNAIIAFPIQGACTPPAFFQLAHYLYIPSSAIYPSSQIDEQPIYQFAEVHSQWINRYEVVHEVV
jgi:hypothetical protein